MEKLKFQYYGIEEIENQEILDSLSLETSGIFRTIYNGTTYWIESNEIYYLFNDGWNEFRSTDFGYMVGLLEEFILKNS